MDPAVLALSERGAAALVVSAMEATHAILANVEARKCFYAVTVGRRPMSEKVREPFRLFPRI